MVAKCIQWAGTSMHQRDQIVARGFAKGLKINIGFSHVGYVLGTTEPEVQAALDMLLRPGMTVYDIGANVGFHAISAARRIGLDAKVVCFEPLPDNVKQIEYNAASNQLTNIQVVTGALGSSEGEAAFWTSRQPTWGKLASVGIKPDKFAKEVKVRIRRLDSVVEELKLPPPDADQDGCRGCGNRRAGRRAADPSAIPPDSPDRGARHQRGDREFSGSDWLSRRRNRQEYSCRRVLLERPYFCDLWRTGKS